MAGNIEQRLISARDLVERCADGLYQIASQDTPDGRVAGFYANMLDGLMDFANIVLDEQRPLSEALNVGINEDLLTDDIRDILGQEARRIN